MFLANSDQDSGRLSVNKPEWKVKNTTNRKKIGFSEIAYVPQNSLYGSSDFFNDDNLSFVLSYDLRTFKDA